jgi:hypothetical protein
MDDERDPVAVEQVGEAEAIGLEREVAVPDAGR